MPRARLRLLCFPWAGAGASVFRSWVNVLPPEIELCAIQLPGREDRLREPPLTRLASLVQALSAALQPHLTRPFALFGHSLGSLVSFELARHLRRQHGLTPAHLFVSAHRAPHLPDPRPPIHQLPDPEFLTEIRRLGGTPEEVLQDKELMQLLLPTLRADLALAEVYRYTIEKPLDCPITALGGLHDGSVSRQELAAWDQHTSGSFVLRMFEGNHFFLHNALARLLPALSRDLQGRLQGADSPSSRPLTARSRPATFEV